MKISKKIMLLTAALSASSIAYADVPVVDAYDDSSSVQTSSAPAPSSSSTVVVKENNQDIKVTPIADDNSSSVVVSAPTDNSAMSMKDRVSILEKQVQNFTKMLNQYNTLQNQMQEMHGQLEIQKHVLKVLQTQMKSQYQDLDRRMGQTNSKPTQTPNNTATDDISGTASIAPTDKIPAVSADKLSGVQTSPMVPAVAVPDPINSADQTSYDAAFNLLKNKSYSQATVAFQKFVKQYPSSANVTNARYWLGQLYLLQGQPDKAITQFRVILKNTPTHPKVPDTLLQLGLAYYAKGDLAHARMEFNHVKQTYPTTNAAKLAQNRLQQMNSSAASSADNAPAAATTE